MSSNGAGDIGVSGRALIGRAVRWRGVRLGIVSDVLLDAGMRRALGFEVECESGEHRFLPTAACQVEAGVHATSPLALVEPGSLEFYRRCGIALAEPVRRVVIDAGKEAGTLEGVEIDLSGEVVGVLVGRHGDTRRLSPQHVELKRAHHGHPFGPA